jgi:phage shock protein B
LLDELYALGRRLDERMGSIERILGDEDPAGRPVAADRPANEDKERLRRIK